MLAMAKLPVKNCRPLPCDAYSPALLLNSIQSTHNVSSLFACQHYVQFPY